ncbi:MAG: tetratricopeptide repeat protein [Bacteroidales bacterium]|nr:tetratricopeptide repeat protein [Bacteroidales bacterium]
MNENQEQFFEEESIYESINRFEEMLKKNSAYFFDLYEFENIVDFYIDQHSFHSAKTAIEKGLKQHPYSTALKLRLAQIYINNGKPSKGLHFLRKIEGVESNNSEFFLLKGIALNVLGRKEEASYAFNKAIQYAYEGKEDIIYSIAYSYINTRRYKLAIKFLKLLIEINPKNTMALHELAMVYERIDDLQKSVVYYKKYIDLEPYSENIWFNLGMVYSSLEQYEDAIEAYDFAIAISPDYVSAYFSKANTHVLQENYEEAIKTYEEIIFIEPDNAQVYTYIGECYEKLLNYKLAIHYYRKSIELDSAFGDAWFGMGMGFFHMDEYALSLKYFIHAKGIDPENPEYWFMLGEAYRKLNILEKSAESYNRAVELDPNDYEAWLSHADILFMEDNLTEAINILNKAYQYNKDISTINYNLAVYYLYNKQDQLAYEYFEKGLSINYNEHSELLSRYPKTTDNKIISQLIKKYKNQS